MRKLIVKNKSYRFRGMKFITEKDRLGQFTKDNIVALNTGDDDDDDYESSGWWTDECGLST